MSIKRPWFVMRDKRLNVNDSVAEKRHRLGSQLILSRGDISISLSICPLLALELQLGLSEAIKFEKFMISGERRAEKHALGWRATSSSRIARVA